MAYSFIELEKTATSKLIAHLAKQCGFEKDASTPRDELVTAILEFEEANNLVRPVDLLPDDLRPVTVISATAELPAKLEIPVRKHPKVKIKINEDTSLNGKGDVYCRVNEYEALVKRNTEVEVPMPVYRMLLDAVEVKGEQLPNGDLMFREVPAYNVTYLGNLD